jgi:acetyl-CoA carboxylase carboxyl transferase subunit alpha
MLKMAGLKVPIISIVIGEGSSGGALAIGVGNKVLMLENAIYSILSPEGYASILWKDSSRAKEAAEKMRLTAKDLYDLNVIDKIIKEPKDDFEKLVKSLKKEIVNTTKELTNMTEEELVEQRYKKFRQMGEYQTI